MKKKTLLRVCGRDVKVTGRVVRVASLDGDKYVFPDDPAAMRDGLRKTRSRIDLFTFLQPLTETSQKYPYHAESDNLAVLPISTFDHWWNNQLRSYPRNRARQAEKRGVVLREVALNEDLFKGICEIYNETPIRQGKALSSLRNDPGTSAQIRQHLSRSKHLDWRVPGRSNDWIRQAGDR